MIKRDIYKQTTPSATWAVQVPTGGVKGRPLAAYGLDGSSIEIDSWSFDANGILHVNFGIDPVAGELVYEYQDQTTHDHVKDKPLVNIEHNYGGVNVGSDSFRG